MKRAALAGLGLAVAAGIAAAALALCRSGPPPPPPPPPPAKKPVLPAKESALPVDQSIWLPDARKLFPKAVRVVVPKVKSGWSRVFDARGRLLGRVVCTSPTADHIVGHGGVPLSILMAAAPDGKVIGAHLLEHGDSPEHVKMAIDDGMLERWNGHGWRKAAAMEVDTVSGATLSSKVMREGVRFRLKLAVKAEGG